MHVQQGGRRFATGGADCLVKVWSLAPVLDAAREKGGPLVLATLSDHSSTVNTVRFSKNGKFLASGARRRRRGWARGAAPGAAPPGRCVCRPRNATARLRGGCCARRCPPARLHAAPRPRPPPPRPGSDDRMICVYEHRPGPGSATLGGGGANPENWRTRLVLRGHSNNVVDLAWSPDDARLASASIDNGVCIWDAASGQLQRRLDYHTSFVKGLAWDPVGTYLATQVGWGRHRNRRVWWGGWMAGQLAAAAAPAGPAAAMQRRMDGRSWCRAVGGRARSALPRCGPQPCPRQPCPRPPPPVGGQERSGVALRRLERGGGGARALRQARHLHLLHTHVLEPRRLLLGHRWVG